MNRNKISIWNLVTIGIFVTACHSTKKVTTNNPSNITKDTIVSRVEPTKTVDTAELANNIWNTFKNKKLNYRSISGKLGVSINMVNLDKDVNANLKMAKDSLIWISLTGPFNFEVARTKITQDSIIIMNKLNKSVQKQNLGYIQHLIGQPVSFDDLQNLLIGKGLLLDGTLETYHLNVDGTWTLSVKKGNLQNTVIISPTANTISKNTLVDLQQANRTLNVQYKDFYNSAIGNIPKRIELSVSGKDKIEIILTYKQMDFNQTLEFPFNIPNNYNVQ